MLYHAFRLKRVLISKIHTQYYIFVSLVIQCQNLVINLKLKITRFESGHSFLTVIYCLMSGDIEYLV